MVFYQPTPVRHIRYLIAATALAEDDFFVDVGSGLGHVSVLVSMVTGARSVGIEVQASYVASARECAQSLHLSRVRFIPQDAREADLSRGTVFYLYSPFNGSILTGVLSALRMESTRRSIKICSLWALHPYSCEGDMAEGGHNARYGAHYRVRLSMSSGVRGGSQRAFPRRRKTELSGQTGL